MVNKVIYGTTVLVDLTEDTVDAAHLGKGYTAHGKDGEPIIGTFVSESLDTSDATATASDICSEKTAYVNGEKVTGTRDKMRCETGTANILDAPFNDGALQYRSAGNGCFIDFVSTASSDFYTNTGDVVRCQVSASDAGDAVASDVLYGKMFTSSEGVNIPGTLVVQTYRTGSEIPDDSIGDDGDLYLVVSA